MLSFKQYLSESYETEDRKQRVKRQKHERKLERADVSESEELSEISDDRKRSYLDAALKDHHNKFMTPSTTKSKRRSTKLSPAGEKLKKKLDSRRNWIQKTSKNVTGKKHFSDYDSKTGKFDTDFNANKKNFKYTKESEELSEISNERLAAYKEKANKDRLKLGQAHPKHFKRILGMYKASNIKDRKETQGKNYSPKIDAEKNGGRESKYYVSTTKVFKDK